MLRKPVLLFLVLSLFDLGSIRAQNSSGIIDPKRAIDWTAAGVSGGVRSRSTICSTIAAYSGTAAAINTAISACPSGQVVSLGAGTFNLSTGISFSGISNVTLRGAGPNKTFVIFTGTANCGVGGASLCIADTYQGYWNNPQNAANWTAGYLAGTTAITLNKTTGLSVGSVLMLDQLDDTNTDNGQLWICSTINVCSTEGESGVRRSGRSEGQTVVVTSVSSGACPCTVGITPGLYMPNWSAGKSPGAWWPTTPIVLDGVENLSMDHTNAGGGSGVFIENARDCWFKNIRSINSNRAHIWGAQTTRVTIRDSYFYGTQNATSQSYGWEDDVGSNWLAENNICQHVTACTVTGEQSTGNVWSYNYNIDDYYSTTLNWMNASSTEHAVAIEYNLYEGNIGPGYKGDDIHGAHHFGTSFRNRWFGWEPGKAQDTYPVIVQAYNRYHNFIGNVLGTPGFHTTYEGFPASGTSAGPDPGTDVSIFMLGWGLEAAKFSAFNNDTFVRASLMRWGNWDSVNNAVRWNASEVPSGISLYSNAVPSSHTLPASFYLSSRPSFWVTPWGTPPWPAIGPDVTGGNIANSGGFANKTPAQLCFEHSPIDNSYTTTYSATASWSNGVATITIGPNAVDSQAAIVTLSGLNNSAYNGTFSIAGQTSNTVTYALPSNPGGSATGGTLSYAQVLQFDANACYGGTGGSSLSPPTGLSMAIQ